MFIARLIKPHTPLYHAIGKKAKYLDYLFLMRPTLFFPVWIMVLAGISAARATVTPEFYWAIDVNWLVLLLFVGVTLVAGATFVLNQVKDQKADSINEKLFILEKGLVSPETAKSLVKTVTTAGLVITMAVTVLTVAKGDQWHPLLSAVWVVLVYLTWGVLYNHRRFQWSMKPLLGMIANAMAGFFCFMIGWSYVSPDMGTGIIHSIPYVMAFKAISMITTIPDVMGDSEVGKITFAVKYGARWTVMWASLLVVLAVTTGFFLGDPVISTASAVSLPFFLVALVWCKLPHVLRAIRYPIFILAMFICVRYPWFFVAIFVTFYLSKYYYYFRFHLDYPTFQVSHD